MKKAGILILISLIILTFTGCAVTINGKEIFSKDWTPSGETVERTEVKSETVDSQTKISVKNSSGKIEFKPWEKDNVEISIVKKLNASGDDEKIQKLFDDMKVNITKNSGSIEISTKYVNDTWGIRRQSIDLTVMVPAKLIEVSGNLSSGDITLSGFKALKSFDLSASSGSIKALDSAAERFELDITSGNINAENIKANGKVKTSSGNIRIRNVTGNLDLRGTSGNINVDGIEGAVISELSSGNINVKNASLKSASSFNASSGRIEVSVNKLDESGTYKFSASSGNIRLYLQEAANFKFNARASSGNVNTDFNYESLNRTESGHKKELVGTVGTGGPSIDVNVTSGNVYIYKQK